MFKNKYQSGITSIFSSSGCTPLAIWEMKVKNGHIKRITDHQINSLVMEIMGVNVATTYITCPKDPKDTLAIKLPFLVIIAKNLNKYFTFEITVLDDSNMKRRFRASNFQAATRVKTFFTSMPIALSDGWNQIQFNLADFTRRAYGTQYMETCRVQVHANVRLRRVYFCSKLYTEDELPQDFKLYMPVKGKKKMVREEVDKKKTDKPPPPAPPHTPPQEAEVAQAAA